MHTDESSSLGIGLKAPSQVSGVGVCPSLSFSRTASQIDNTSRSTSEFRIEDEDMAGTGVGSVQSNRRRRRERPKV